MISDDDRNPHYVGIIAQMFEPENHDGRWFSDRNFQGLSKLYSFSERLFPDMTKVTMDKYEIICCWINQWNDIFCSLSEAQKIYLNQETYLFGCGGTFFFSYTNKKYKKMGYRVIIPSQFYLF